MKKGYLTTEESRKKDFLWLDRISSLLDNKFNLWGFRFGVDPLLNLIPYAGQVVSFGISLVMIIFMFRNGVGSKVVAKMLVNILLDAVIGAIPFVGYIFDFFFKANRKNMTLLREHYFENKHQGSAKGIIVTILIVLFILCAATFIFFWFVARWLLISLHLF